MSMPNIPDITPDITITPEQAEAMLLAAVALEEMGLAHIINAEAEKIQYVLGTLEGTDPKDPPKIRELLEINDSVATMIRNTIKKEILLSYTLEDVLALCDHHHHHVD